MPAEVTGASSQEMRCTARVVTSKRAVRDGRIGFARRIEKLKLSARKSGGELDGSC